MAEAYRLLSRLNNDKFAIQAKILRASRSTRSVQYDVPSVQVFWARGLGAKVSRYRVTNPFNFNL